MMTTLKGKLKDDEVEYVLDYRNLEALDREKEIKFFTCIGEESATEGQIRKYEEERVEKIEKKNTENRQKDVSLYKSEYNKDQVVVATD